MLLTWTPFPRIPVTAKTARIHQRQQRLRLSTDAAAATDWTHGWIYLTRRQRPSIINSAPRVWAPKTFWQDLIYANHQLEEALSSATLLRFGYHVILGRSDLNAAAMSNVWAELKRPPPSTCSLCASFCAFDLFPTPGGPVAEKLISFSLNRNWRCWVWDFCGIRTRQHKMKVSSDSLPGQHIWSWFVLRQDCGAEAPPDMFSGDVSTGNVLCGVKGAAVA